MAQDPKDVARRFFDTLSTGEFDKIAEFFSEDSTWTVNDVANGFPSQRGRAIVDARRPARSSRCMSTWTATMPTPSLPPGTAAPQTQSTPRP